MTDKLDYVRHGFGAVRPYVYGPLGLWDLVRDAFGAEELERHAVGPKSFHVEARVGDAAVVLEIGDPPHEGATPSSVYVYVPDVDGAYRRALDHGAASIATPVEKPYAERAAGVRDTFGNIWWIATFRG